MSSGTIEHQVTIPSTASWQEGVSNLNVLMYLFDLKNQKEAAEHLGTSEASVTRLSKYGNDIAGLAPAVLEALYPGVSEIALRAQLMEFELRQLHASSVSASSAKATSAMRDKLEESAARLLRLRELFNEMRSPMTDQMRAERAVDRAAMCSLEGQLSTYTKDYPNADQAFKRCLSHLNGDHREMKEFGALALRVRATLNRYFVNHQMGVDVSHSVIQPTFVSSLTRYISITRDSRVSIIVAEAFAENGKYNIAAGHLCDAAELLKLSTSDLKRHQPIGYHTALEKISVFERPLHLMKEVKVKRDKVNKAKQDARKDLYGKEYLGSSLDDANLFN